MGCNLPRLDITKGFGSMKGDRGRERERDADREGVKWEGGVIGWAAGKGVLFELINVRVMQIRICADVTLE